MGALKKEIGMLLREPLFLGKWCGVATYFFFMPKKEKEKEKLNTKYIFINTLNVID